MPFGPWPGGTGGAGGTYTPPAGTVLDRVVRLATTANQLLTGLAAVDGVVPVAGDRIFARVQTAPAENGIYTAAAGAWTRAIDWDAAAEILPGSMIVITEGATMADTLWELSTNGVITPGVTAQAFKSFGPPVPTTAQSGAAIGPAVTVTFTTPNILSVRSGLFYVVAHLGADGSGTATYVISGGADGGANLALTKAGTGGAGPFNGAVSFVVQLAAGVNHTFFIKSIASAGTNTIIANSAQISVIEF